MKLSARCMTFGALALALGLISWMAAAQPQSVAPVQPTAPTSPVSPDVALNPPSQPVPVQPTPPAQANPPAAPGTPPPAAAPAKPPVEVVQASSRIGPRELDELAAALQAADGAAVIVRVPGSATIHAAASDLRRLAAVPGLAHLFVVQQGNARLDGAAAILSAFAAASFRQPGYGAAAGPPDGLWPIVEQVRQCQPPCRQSSMISRAPGAMGLTADAPTVEVNPAASGRPLTAALTQPPPGSGAPGLPVGLSNVLFLIAGALAAAGLARTWHPRRRGLPTGEPITRLGDPITAAGTPGEVVDPRPLLMPSPPGSRRRVSPAPPRSRHSRRAKVVSVLDPEGYVELDACLQRIRWSGLGMPAALPGEWVEIETDGRRLWGYPAARTNAPRRHGRAPHRKEVQP